MDKYILHDMGAVKRDSFVDLNKAENRQELTAGPDMWLKSKH